MQNWKKRVFVFLYMFLFDRRLLLPLFVKLRHKFMSKQVDDGLMLIDAYLI